MSDDIQIDETGEESTPVPTKVKSATPAWVVLLVILTFACLAGTLALQFLEFQTFADL
jgi:hypothetical protein